MTQHRLSVDYVIIGAGIVGLSLAREILLQHTTAKIVILEKEDRVGVHASGRNSGVLHSGIYYSEHSIKANICAEGLRAMVAYCEEHRLPLHKIGKIIIPSNRTEETLLDMLYQRGHANGVKVEYIDHQLLTTLEPLAASSSRKALYIPDTSVLDPLSVLAHLQHFLVQHQVKFFFKTMYREIDVHRKQVNTNTLCIRYNHLFNTAGLHADNVALACGLPKRYNVLPIKGKYYELHSSLAKKINHLLYPVPDLAVPFLGIHVTKSISGKVYLGPNAIPALGRENYHYLKGINFTDCSKILLQLGRQYLCQTKGFRPYVHREIQHVFKKQFIKAVQSLVPSIKKNDLIASNKVGVRAQLYDQDNNAFVMDFLIARTKNETHVLNAVSPAFTCAFPFAKKIIQAAQAPYNEEIT